LFYAFISGTRSRQVKSSQNVHIEAQQSSNSFSMPFSQTRETSRLEVLKMPILHLLHAVLLDTRNQQVGSSEYARIDAPQLLHAILSFTSYEEPAAGEKFLKCPHRGATVAGLLLYTVRKDLPTSGYCRYWLRIC
jgi:hypothetical protein